MRTTLTVTVSIGTQTRKDIEMKLLAIIFAILAFSLAETIEKNEDGIEDLEVAAASVELKRTRKETLEPAASTYNSYVPPSQRPPKEWTQNIPHVPANNYNHNQNYFPNNPAPTNFLPPVNNYIPPVNNYIPPQNNYIPPQNDYIPPQNDYIPPQNHPAPPQNHPAPTQNYPAPTQNPHVQPQNDYYPTKPTWVSTTPASVITNTQYNGENGSYKYEYQLSDGTWVGEEGYTLYPNTKYENLVKKGWYSYRGADGKVYTVTWWADNSGYHAFGDHLPQPPPIPPAIQASLDQAARDEEIKAEAEKNKPIYTTEKPSPTFQPFPQPTYPQPTYPQPTYPQPTYPQPTYPQPTYPQPTYTKPNYPQTGYPQPYNQHNYHQ